MEATAEQKRFIAWALQNGDGVSYSKLCTCDKGDVLCLVVGRFEDGYRAKLAFNIDDLQCDYDCDWYMPFAESGEVYDTDTYISTNPEVFDWEYWLGEAETIRTLVNQGAIKPGK